jgi:hypothetical protein
MGVGLAVISALADRAEFLSAPDGGTEVRMAFADRGAGVQTLERPSPRRTRRALPQLSGDLVATLSPVGMLAGVLGRLARAEAAGARFSLDRFSDVYLVTDGLAAYAEPAADGLQISFAIRVTNRRLEITIGPFRRGSGAKLKAGRADAPLLLLTDELDVEQIGAVEMLRVVMVDRRGL